MTFRFRKRIKLFPGVHINLSKSGISTSIGKPGATINLKDGRKARATIGIPGTGLSDSFNIANDEAEHQESNWGSAFVSLLICRSSDLI
jgi:Protein of unknown function (DUF4236)